MSDSIIHKKNLTMKTKRKSASAKPEVLKYFKPNLTNDTLGKKSNFITLSTSFLTTDMIPLPSKLRFVLQPNFSLIEKLRKPLLLPLDSIEVDDVLKQIQQQYENLHIKKTRKPKILKVTKSEKQRAMIANFVDNQIKDFAWMADQVGLTRQQVRNIALNYSKTDQIEKNKAGRKPKLGEDQKVLW